MILFIMKTIHFFILNMEKNLDRFERMIRMIMPLKCSFSRIVAINGQTMNDNEECKELLKLRPELLGQTFKHLMTEEEWVYDGTIATSFPNCALNKSFGTKGLTLSNIKAFQLADNMEYDWFCILEDDAEIDKDVYNKIIEFINKEENQQTDIVLLDERHWGWGGTAGMLYNKKIIKQLINDLHPLSYFSIQSYLYGNKGLGNLWDWKLWKYVCYVHTNFTLFPLIKSGYFNSTITD